MAEESLETPSGRRLLSQPEWFAALGVLLSQVGSRHFPDVLSDTVSRLAPFNYMVSFAYSGPGKPVCLHHTFGPKQFDIHVREYEVGPYLLDPFYKATANGIRSGIYKLADWRRTSSTRANTTSRIMSRRVQLTRSPSSRPAKKAGPSSRH